MTKASVFGNKNVTTNPETDRVIAEGGSKFTGKVFLYMFIALAITALSCFLFGRIVANIAVDTTGASGETFATILIIALLLLLPLMIWIQVSVLRGGKGLTPAFVIYSVIMGFFLSTFTVFLPFDMIATAFALTCGAFGIMALIAWTSKKNLNSLAVAGLGFLAGAAIISLFSLIFFWITNDAALVVLNAIVSAGVFIYMILMTIYDLYNIRRIASRGEGSSNLAMVCAFSLYVDFIYVFIRILIFLAKIVAIFGRNK